MSEALFRPGGPHTAAAFLLAVVSGTVVVLTATQSGRLVNTLVAFALVTMLVALAFGFHRGVGVSTIPLAAAVMVEPAFSDGSSWVRSLVIGCLWFVTVEAGWEAIDRRDGSQRTTAAAARKVQELCTVIAIAVVVGMIGGVATGRAPERTVLVQAVVLLPVLAAFVALVRRMSVSR